MVKKQTSKKVLAACAVGLVALSGLAGAGIHALAAEPVIKEVPVDVIKEVEVIKEVPVNVTVEKLVDNGKLAEVTQYLEDKDFFDDANKVVAQIEAEKEAIAMAVEKIEADGFDFLEDKDLFNDEDDLEFIKIYSDLEDVKFVKADFDDKEYKLEIEAKVEDVRKEVKKRVVFTVSIEDGDVELKKVEEA